MKKAILWIMTFFYACLGAETVQELDQKISHLKKDLHELNIEEMKAEMKANRDMIAEWPAYAEEMKKIQEKEHQEQQLIKEIQELEKRKEKAPH